MEHVRTAASARTAACRAAAEDWAPARARRQRARPLTLTPQKQATRAHAARRPHAHSPSAESKARARTLSGAAAHLCPFHAESWARARIPRARSRAGRNVGVRGPQSPRRKGAHVGVQRARCVPQLPRGARAGGRSPRPAPARMARAPALHLCPKHFFFILDH